MQLTTAEETVPISNPSSHSTPAAYHSFPTSLEAVTKAIEAFERQFPSRCLMNGMQSSANLYGHQEETEEAQVVGGLSAAVNEGTNDSASFSPPPSATAIPVESGPINNLSPYPEFGETPSWVRPNAFSSSSSRAQMLSRVPSEKNHANFVSGSFYPEGSCISPTAIATSSALPLANPVPTTPRPIGIQLGLVEGQPNRYGLRSSLSRVSTSSISPSLRDVLPDEVTAYPSPSRGSSQGSLDFDSDLSSLSSEEGTSSDDNSKEGDLIEIVAGPQPKENLAPSNGPWMSVPVAANWGEMPGPMVVREPFVLLDEADLIEEVSEITGKDEESLIERDSAIPHKKKTGPGRRSLGKRPPVKDEPKDGQFKGKGKTTERRKYTRRAASASATLEAPIMSGRITELPDPQTNTHPERRREQPRRKSLSSSSSSLTTLPTSSLSDRSGSTHSGRPPPSPSTTNSNQLLPIRRRSILAFPPRKSQVESERAPILTPSLPTISSGSSSQTRRTIERRTERRAEDGRMVTITTTTIETVTVEYEDDLSLDHNKTTERTRALQHSKRKRC